MEDGQGAQRACFIMPQTLIGKQAFYAKKHIIRQVFQGI
jgi:hypothetical protein